jgi:antitoxin PrlF
MTTTITQKGQVTLPKQVRDAVGLKPGDEVEVRATASGGVYIEKPGKRVTTDELMEMLRGEGESSSPKKR